MLQSCDWAKLRWSIQYFLPSLDIELNSPHSDVSILIATRSHLSPLSNDVSQTAGLDSTSSAELERPVVHLTEGEPSGEESVINITEVQLRFNGLFMSEWVKSEPIILTNLAQVSPQSRCHRYQMFPRP